MAAAPIETALDELYAAAPDEFVAARKALAARLRSDGEAAAAKVLAAARRPTTAAAALNRLAREQPELVDVYLARSAELQAGYGGSRDDLRTATRAHRDALAAATDAAMGLLDTRPTEAYRAQVQATLHAASLDVDVAEQLQRGRVVKETAGPTGFGDDGPARDDDEPAPARRPARSKARPAKSSPAKASPTKLRSVPTGDDDDAAEDEAAVARAERERVAAEEAAAEEEAERRRAEHQAARESAEADAVAAEAEARDARARVEEAKEALEAARVEAKAAEQRATAAKRAAEKLARDARR